MTCEPLIVRPAARPRAAGFTLVELLVVIGIIACLMGVLMPALAAARDQARLAVCTSNIRQLGTAAVMYVGENRGYWPPAHYNFYTRNLHRWHGERKDAASPFDFADAPIRPQLGTAAVKSCPAVELPDATAGFERSAGGYGYNAAYLGSSTGVPGLGTLSLPIAEFEAKVINVPAKATQVIRPGEKVAFADAAIANPLPIEYSFVEPPLLDGTWPSSPSIQFRHRRRAAVSWADGHVTAERFEWTYPTNAYGADNAKSDLGFFGPRDNALFKRD